MSDKSPEALLASLEKARTLVKVGGIYAHYKNSEHHYLVHDLIITEATLEVEVVYEALYATGLKFSRPLSDWLGSVDWQGQTVPRFTLVEQ